MEDAHLNRAAFLGGLALAGIATAAPALAEPMPLTIGTAVDSPTQLPAYIGIKQTFPAQNLDVKFLSFRGDAEVSQALAGGSVDVALSSSSGLLSLVVANQPVRGFYGGFNQADFSWLAQPGITSWGQLKGKSIGISTFGSLTDLITRYVLSKNKLDPDKDVTLVQAGGSPSAYQALQSKRLDAAILGAPFKWEAQDNGFKLLGTQAEDVSPNWPKHFYMAKTSFIEQKPQVVTALLRGHVAALRLAKANPALAVQTLVDRLKYDPKYAQRAYAEAMPSYDERGRIPEKSMPLFWKLSVEQGIVKAPLPEKAYMDFRYIDTFANWAPKA